VGFINQPSNYVWGTVFLNTCIAFIGGQPQVAARSDSWLFRDDFPHVLAVESPLVGDFHQKKLTSHDISLSLLLSLSLSLSICIYIHINVYMYNYVYLYNIYIYVYICQKSVVFIFPCPSLSIFFHQVPNRDTVPLFSLKQR
jgi:hypothetical protein